MNKHQGNARGFTLIELMIAMVAGIVVVGSALVFTISSLRSNSEFVQAARLNQELRNSMDFVSRELRRASYDESAITYVMNASSATPSPFAPILVVDNNTDASCIIYAYDRQSTAATTDDTTTDAPGVVNLTGGEIRGLRRRVRTVNGQSVGVIEFAESANNLTPACDGASPTYTTYPATCASSGWCPLSDPRQMDVTSFNINITRTTVTTGLQTRDITVSIRGNLPSQTDVVRGLQSSISVRSPCLRTTITDCNAAPVGASGS